MTKREIEKDFVRLIELNGENNELETFELCSNYGLELADSTIDKIVKTPNGSVIFYYNENTDDFDSIYAFEEGDLLFFLGELTDAIFKSNRDTIADHISTMMRAAFTEVGTADEFAENIVDRVMEDMEVTADLAVWNDSDIDLALERVLLEISL